MAVGPINSGAPNVPPPATNPALKPANPQDAGKLQEAVKAPTADELGKRLEDLKGKLDALQQKQKEGRASPADRMEAQSLQSEMTRTESQLKQMAPSLPGMATNIR
jgi:hypothetical protein